MNEIELAIESPFAIEVVNLEFHIIWHISRLNWANICPDDFGIGMIICKIDRLYEAVMKSVRALP